MFSMHAFSEGGTIPASFGKGKASIWNMLKMSDKLREIRERPVGRIRTSWHGKYQWLSYHVWRKEQ